MFPVYEIHQCHDETYTPNIAIITKCDFNREIQVINENTN